MRSPREVPPQRAPPDGFSLSPASLTKVMTALVALESASPQQVVKVDRRALLSRSSLKLHAGEQFLLRDLLTAMLVTSANDACQAVALHVGGEADRFVTMMNERARALGLENTHFANACGFDAPGHYSTAADLARLTEQALQVPAFSMMVRTVTRRKGPAGPFQCGFGSKRICDPATTSVIR